MHSYVLLLLCRTGSNFVVYKSKLLLLIFSAGAGLHNGTALDSRRALYACNMHACIHASICTHAVPVCMYASIPVCIHATIACTAGMFLLLIQCRHITHTAPVQCPLEFSHSPCKNYTMPVQCPQRTRTVPARVFLPPV